MGVVAAPRLRRPRPAAARRALAGRARPLAAAACVGVVVAAGVVIAVAAAAPNSPIVPALRRASPGWLQGPFAGAGVRVTFSGYLMLFAAMSAGYLGVLALGVRVPARWLLGAVAALHVAFLLAPPILSNDVFSYVAYARLGVVHGLDPYAQAPIAAPHDAVYVFTHWRHATSAYGPLFTLGSYPLAPLGVGGALWALKVASALASLGCVALVWKIAEQLGRSPVWAAAAFGLNPVLLVWTVGGAHNDTLMLMLLLAGVWLVLARRDALGGAAIVAGAAIKASAGLALPFVLLGVGLRRGGRALAGAVVAAAVFVIVAALAFPGHALGVVSLLRHRQHMVVFDSVPTEVAHLAGLPGVTPGVRLAFTAGIVIALVLLAVHVRRGGDWVRACGWAFAAVVAGSTWFLAWYAVWPLAFAAVTRDRRLLTATLLLQTYFVVNHIPGFTV